MKPLSRVLGLLALASVGAGSVAAVWMLKHRPVTTRALSEEVAPVAHSGGGSVVCFGYVDLDGGVRTLAPLQPGRVAEVLVREGDTVSTGAVLLRLENHRARLHVEQAHAVFEAAKVQLAQAQVLPQQQRSRVAQQQAVLEVVRHRLSSAGHMLARKQKLKKLDLITAEEAAAVEDQVKELTALEGAELEKLTELRLRDPVLDVRRAETEVNLARARLEEAQQALDECLLKAPEAGKVLRVLAAPATVLSGQPNQAALVFCPNEPRLIRAEVEQEFAEQVQEGQLAEVEDDIRTGNPCNGHVIRVSDWYAQRRAIMQEPLQLVDVRTVECLIALDPGQTTLRIGQRVRVTIRRKMP
jgi:HlyD family secretion protein